MQGCPVPPTCDRKSHERPANVDLLVPATARRRLSRPVAPGSATGSGYVLEGPAGCAGYLRARLCSLVGGMQAVDLRNDRLQFHILRLDSLDRCIERGLVACLCSRLDLSAVAL